MLILGSFLAFPQTTQPRIRRLGHLSMPMMWLMSVFLISLASWMFYMESDHLRGVWQDFRLQKRFIVVEEAEISRKNYCINSRGSITSCFIAFRYQGKIHQQNLSFFATQAKPLPPLKILQSIDNPSYFSSDFALNKLEERSLLALAFSGLALTLVWLVWMLWFKVLPFHRQLLHALNNHIAQPWQIVGLSDWEYTNGQYVLHIELDGQTKRLVINAKDMQPWLITVNGEEYLLAVTPKQEILPAPLDTELKVIDGLNSSQKQAAQRHIQQLIAQQYAKQYTKNPNQVIDIQ